MKDELLQSIEDGKPTAEQAAMLLSMASGDTSFLDGDVPTVAADDADDTDADAGNANTEQDTGEQAEANGAQGEPELNADNAVILAKDGKHTIGYDKLVQAREGEKHWRDQASQAQARIAELEAAAQQREQAGLAPTAQDNHLAVAQNAIDQGVDPELFGDFSEEALAAGIKKLVDAQVAAQVSAQVGKALEPYQQQQQQQQANSHLDAIYKAHPDADSIVESTEFAQWVNSRPAFEQAAIQGVLNAGSTADVVDLFSTFKTATGAVQPDAQPDAKGAKAAAEQALSKAKSQPPASLSDIPGGKPPAGNRFEVIASMEPTAMSEALRDMTPQQVEAFLNTQM